MVRAMGGSLDELAGISVPAKAKQDPQADDRIIAIYQKQIEDINIIHEKRIKDKNTWIKMLFGLTAILLLGIIALFTYDFMNPDRGWYVREVLSRAYARLF